MLNKPSLGVERAERRGPEWQAHPRGYFGPSLHVSRFTSPALIFAFALSCALPGATTSPAADVPYVRFTDITRDAGVTFVHENGAYGDKLLPETMSGGVAFFDYDNDGKPDLLFVNSCYWPGHIPVGKKAAASSQHPTSNIQHPTSSNQQPAASSQQRPVLALYHNEGKGRFKDVTAGSGLDISIYGMGAAIGDYDNDGWADVFITAVGGNHLFHNEGNGKFREVTSEAGVGGWPDYWSSSAAWIDYDNDGKLDLFVCNYIRWSPALDLAAPYELPNIGRAYGPPRNFQGAFPYLFHNDGGGRFSDVTAQAGLQVKHPTTGQPMAKSLAVSPVDADNDGWIDLVVANDTVQNFFFHNLHNGTFKEIGARSGIAYDAYGLVRGAMGIDSARFRNDDSLGIAIGNFANEMNALYVARRDSLVFADEAIKENFGPASQVLLKFGLFFFDYDLDGRLDVLTANGHLEPEISRVQSVQHYRQPAQLFWNRGDPKGFGFLPVTPAKCGEDLFKPIVGRGSAFADIDGDGDLDVVLTQIAGPPLLLRNDQKLGHHWVRLKLVGTRSNRDAIGAWVKMRVGEHTLSRQVMPSRSYLSQSELPVTFGLGTATKVEGVEIVWPLGAVQKIGALPIDQTTVITEPK